MTPNTFDQQIEAARQRLAELEERAGGSAEQGVLLAGETLADLSTALEELHVAAEELHQQNEELAATRQVVEAERQRYQDLFDFAPDGYLVTDMEGIIREANRAAATLLGVRQEFMVSKPLVVFVAEEARQAFHGRLTQMQEDARTPEDWETQLQPRDGAPFSAALTVGRVRDAAGRLTGVRWLVRDITQRKRLEAQMRQAQKMEAIGTLAGGIAHDFNNLLSAMIAHTELASDSLSPGSTVGQNLQAVLAAAGRAKDLVQQILLFSRQREQERKPVLLHLIVKEAMKLRHASLPDTIEICQQIDPASGAVLADPTQMHQVLMNLCTNAEHAMREGGGVLDVRLEAVEAEADFAANHPPLKPGLHVRLTVRDSGHGMEPRVRDRIFEPFFTTKDVREGTGMGLAVVHGIVAGHGGTITVDTAPGRGAEFEVYLPQCDSPKAVETPEEEPLRGGRERILIVDDEPLLVYVWKTVLERLGYQAVGLTSSLEALEALRAAPASFDLVITDLLMPRLTGEALARELLRLRPDLPIILCTGFSDIMTEEKAKAMGIRAFLMKPLGVRDIGRAVRRVLDARTAKKS